MHTLRLSSTVVALMSLVACGGSDGDDSDKPIATTPLTGTIDGRAFTAVSALAEGAFEDNEKFINIYESQVDCFGIAPDGSRRILLSRVWAPLTQELSFSNNVTFVVDKDDGPLNVIATEGRLEIVDAPATAGAMGTLRLRASSGADTVEGQVSVKVCD